jgi:hypothetical protein
VIRTVLHGAPAVPRMPAGQVESPALLTAADVVMDNL